MQNKNYSVNKSHVISIIILVTVSLISYCFYSLNCHIKNIFLINEKTNTQIFTDIIKIPSSYILSKKEIKSYLMMIMLVFPEKLKNYQNLIVKTRKKRLHLFLIIYKVKHNI